MLSPLGGEIGWKFKVQALELGGSIYFRHGAVGPRCPPVSWSQPAPPVHPAPVRWRWEAATVPPRHRYFRPRYSCHLLIIHLPPDAPAHVCPSPQTPDPPLRPGHSIPASETGEALETREQSGAEPRRWCEANAQPAQHRRSDTHDSQCSIPISISRVPRMLYLSSCILTSARQAYEHPILQEKHHNQRG